MMVTTRGSLLRMLLWQWRAALAFLSTGALAVGLHALGWTWLALPSLPVSVAGATLGFYVAFRTNNAYERWWEGRRLWGGLVNASRLLASQAIAYLPRPAAERLVRRHLGYVHWLRCALRDQALDDEALRWLGAAPAGQSPGLTLLHAQLEDLAALARAGELDEIRLQSLDRTLAALHDVQGGCERIKRTPLPRGYAFMAERFTHVFGVLFPFAIVKDLGAATPVVNLLVCIAFALISESGRVLEDPFTTFWNGLPLSALSRNIEIQLRGLLGETDLPAPVAIDAQGVLL